MTGIELQPLAVDSSTAAKLLGISLRSLARLDAELRPARLGRLRRYTVAGLQDFLECQRAPATSESPPQK
ncbi:MAG: helix-turn-helix domain-containing protein [Planctomyces sp.]|nr:helix-turn-helix domain-containing protein [Planctomyces sp.]